MIVLYIRAGGRCRSWSVSGYAGYAGSAGYGGIVYCSADLDNFVQFGDFDRQRRFYQIYILQGTGEDRQGQRLLYLVLASHFDHSRNLLDRTHCF